MIISWKDSFTNSAFSGNRLTVDWSIGDRKELDLLGSHLSPYCYPLSLKHQQWEPENEVVSKTFPLKNGNRAFDYATGKYGDFKVAITFE